MYFVGLKNLKNLKNLKDLEKSVNQWQIINLNSN